MQPIPGYVVKHGLPFLYSNSHHRRWHRMRWQSSLPLSNSFMQPEEFYQGRCYSVIRNIVNWCCPCSQRKESIYHIFIQSRCVQSLFIILFSFFRVYWVLSHSMKELLSSSWHNIFVIRVERCGRWSLLLVSLRLSYVAVVLLFISLVFSATCIWILIRGLCRLFLGTSL